MELVFLNLGSYRMVQDYHQHLQKMINIKLIKGDTYINLFEKLEERFKDTPDKLVAVKSWIQLNKDEQEDESVFNTVLCDDETCYASFDLIK